jgi:GDP-4-dehydro-6-deoxy-D-mannose reductase
MMEKYLITGSAGFVSRHFLDFLEQNRIESEVLGIDLQDTAELPKFQHVHFSFQKLDLTERDSLTGILSQFNPDYILHLASYSSVAFSWKQPVTSFQNNTNIFLNLVEAIRETGIRSRILSIGSSEEYGMTSGRNLPIVEEQPLNPVSPYAVARVSQEFLGRLYAGGYGLDIVLTRSFNHIGPGQRSTFAIPSFIRQMVALKEKGQTRGEIMTGDVGIERDFLDVRDVVRAYYVLLKRGERGGIYNICRGESISLERIICNIAGLLDFEAHIRVDENLIRPTENRVIFGSNAKLRALGWDVTIALDDSLRAMIDYWQSGARERS